MPRSPCLCVHVCALLARVCVCVWRYVKVEERAYGSGLCALPMREEKITGRM